MEQLRVIFYPEFFIKCSELAHQDIQPQVYENIIWTLANITGQEQSTEFRDKLLTHPLFVALYNLRNKFNDRPDLVENIIWMYGNVIKGPNHPSLEYSRMLLEYCIEMFKKYKPYHVSDKHNILYEAMYMVLYFLEPVTDRAERREILYESGVMKLVLPNLEIKEPRRLKPILDAMKMYGESLNKKYIAELTNPESIKVTSSVTSISKLSCQSQRMRPSFSLLSKSYLKC